MQHIMERFCLAVITLLLSARCAVTSPLSSNFTPTSYAVTLTVPEFTNVQSAVVTGNVTITLQCSTDDSAGTSSIQFHYGASLTPASLAVQDIRSFVVASADGTAVDPPVTVTAVSAPQDSVITLTTSAPITPKQIVTFAINFTTPINRDTRGLFYRQFTNAQGGVSTILMTNLKPFYARELFPCLDEPRFTAAITITLTRPSAAWSAVSTLPAGTTSGKTDTFASPSGKNLAPHSLGLFLYTSDVSRIPFAEYQSTTRLEFFARSSYTGTALRDNMAFLANYYYQVEGLLGQVHPLTTLNIVFVPNLPAPVAAYGIIFIREDTYAGDYLSAQAEGLFRMRVFPVLREFLRQFTEFSTRPRLWSDSWMSDALTNYLQYTLLYALGLPFDFQTDFTVAVRQTALALDSPSSASPLQNAGLDSADSTAALELGLSNPLRSIKGAVLLSMLDMSFPAGTVFSSIKAFLKNNRETLVTSSDLYSRLKTDIAGSGAYLSTAAMTALNRLDFWFNTTGYGIVSLGAATVGNPGSITLSLGKFCESMPCPSTSTSPSYSVAVTVGSRTSPRYYMVRQDLWVNSTTTTSAALALAAGDWVVANLHSSGYYRAGYPSDDWAAITSAVSSGSKEIVGLAQVVDDAFANALATGQAADFNMSVRLAVASLRQPSFANWYPVATGLSRVRDRVLGTPHYNSYKNFMQPYLTTVNAMLQNGSLDAIQSAKVFSLFLDAMCELDIPGYRSIAASNATTLLSGVLPTMVPSSSYDGLVCCAAKNDLSMNPYTLWNNIVDSSSTSTFYTKHYSAVALGCNTDFTSTVQLFTTMLKTDAPQIKPHLLRVFTYLADNYPTELAASLPANAANLQTRLGAAALAALITRVGNKINNNTQASVMSSVSSVANIDPVVRDAVTSTVNAVAVKVTWLNANGASLASALDTYRTSGGTPSGGTSGTTATTVSLLALTFPLFLSAMTK